MNENRVVFVEGIPGSGKTSLSHKLMHEYEGLGYHVRLYGECQKNPLDLARCAMLSKEDFDALIVAVRKKNSKTAEKITQSIYNDTVFENGKYYVYFDSLFDNSETASIGKAIKKYDIYNGGADFLTFKKHIRKWKQFAIDCKKDSGTVYIFDGVLIQSPLYELLGYFQVDKSEAAKYICEIYDNVRNLNTNVYYNFTKDISGTMNYARLKRLEQGKQWGDGFARWVEAAPYCRARNYSGFEGAIKFIQDRVSYDYYILGELKTEIIYRSRDES